MLDHMLFQQRTGFIVPEVDAIDAGRNQQRLRWMEQQPMHGLRMTDHHSHDGVLLFARVDAADVDGKVLGNKRH